MAYGYVFVYLTNPVLALALRVKEAIKEVILIFHDPIVYFELNLFSC